MDGTVTEQPEGALTGYQFLDLADKKGALCTKLLADLGADVIRIEVPEGNSSRWVPPFAGDEPHPEKSLFHLYHNANKRGITLDLETSEGKSIFKSLIKTADGLVETYPPGYMASLGLEYAALRDINPGLIMASITDFGQTGPYRDWKGSDIVDFALSGCMILSGFPDKTPCNLPGTPSYDAASLVAGIAILVALYSRWTTGEGQYIDTSVWESAWAGIYPWTFAPVHYDPPRPEIRMGTMLYPVYPCKDGHVRVMAIAPRQWEALVRLLGNPQVLLIPEWKDMVYRIAYADELRAIVLEYTMKHTMTELFEAGHMEGVPISPVGTVVDFIDSPQTKARKSLVEIDHPVIGKALYPGPPYKWTQTSCGITRPAPCLGQHNNEVFNNAVNISRKGMTASGYRLDPCPEQIKARQAPLEGIRVICFGSGAVVPDLGKTLGEFGADVIIIESRQNLDVMRTLGEEGIDSSSTFNEANRSKRSFGVNLRTEKGRQIVRQLIGMSDIVAENLRGGALKSLGLDYEHLRQLKPDLIYISCSGFGLGGPYSDYPAWGPLLLAFSGAVHLWAHTDDPYPVGSHVSYPDHMASKQATLAVLAALDYRRRTGKGQFVDMALIEVAFNLIGEVCLDYTVNKRIQKPIGNRGLYAAPHGCYRCSGDDQWCVVSVFTDDEWQGFCRVIGNPDWTTRPEFADPTRRLGNVDQLDRLVEEWTINREPDDVMQAFQRAGVPAGVVMHASNTLKDPHLRARDAIVELEHSVTGRKPYPSTPFKLSATPPLPSTPAPLFGQHTDEICREILQLPENEIKRLKEAGVLEGPCL